MLGFIKILISYCCFINFAETYVLLSDYVEGFPKVCYVKPVILNPPLPELNVTFIKPGEILGVEYDENKNYCGKLECTLWSNDRGEGFKLKSDGCALVKRPKNCSAYTEENFSLPYPRCCYYSKCPRKSH